MVSSTLLLTTLLTLSTPLLASPFGLGPTATPTPTPGPDPNQTRAVFDLFTCTDQTFNTPIQSHSPNRNIGQFDIQGPGDLSAGTFRLGLCSNFSFPTTGLEFGGVRVNYVLPGDGCVVHIYTGANCDVGTEVQKSPFKPADGCQLTLGAHSYNVTCTA